MLLHALSTRGKATLRAGQQPEPAPPGPLRRRAGLPGADASPTSTAPRWPARCSTSSPAAAKTEPVGPGQRPRSTGRAGAASPFNRGPVETTALAALAFAQARPADARARRGRRLAPGPPRRHRLAAAQGQGAGAGRAGGLLRPGARRPRTATAGRHGQRRPRSTRLEVAGPAEGKAILVPARGAEGRRPEPGPVRHRGARHVRLRGHPDRLHPRLRPRPGRAANRSAVDRPPRLPRRPTPSSTARPCRPASASAVNAAARSRTR